MDELMRIFTFTVGIEQDLLFPLPSWMGTMVRSILKN